MNLFCIGLSHHTANVETRERYARHADIDATSREQARCAEALLLSTCNRVEVYGVSEGLIDSDVITRYLAASSATLLEDASAFYR